MKSRILSHFGRKGWQAVALLAVLLSAVAMPCRATSRGVRMGLTTGSLSMMSMGMTTLTVTATPVGGVTLPANSTGMAASIVSGLPGGFVASWSEPVISTGAVDWTLTLSGGVNAKGGNNTLEVATQITDADTGVVYSAIEPLTLNVALTTPTLKISSALTTVPVVAGGSATNVFSLTGGGSYQGPVTLSVSGLPSGVTASWSSNPVTLVAGEGSSTVTFSANAAASVNYFAYTVTAVGDGLTVTKTDGLQVDQAPGMNLKLSQSSLSLASMGTTTMTVTAVPVGGATVPTGAAGASAEIVSGLPSGFTASWSSPTISAAGAVSWVLTLTGGVNAAGSSGTLDLMAQITSAANSSVYSASQTLPLKVSFTPPTLNITPALYTLPVVQGASAINVLTIAAGGSYQSPVALAASGLPSGVTASWSSNPASLTSDAGSSTLIVTASATAPLGYFTFNVTASGDGLTLTRTYGIKVLQAPGIQVQLSTANLSMVSMGTGNLTITAIPIGGVTVPAGAAGALPEIVSGLPAGFTSSWSSPVVTAAGAVSWTLTLTGGINATAGSGVMQISAQIIDATSGSAYSASQPLALNVTLTPPTLGLMPASPAIAVEQGQSVTDVFILTGGGSYQGPVTLAVSGLPSGVSASWSNSVVGLVADSASSTLTLTTSTAVPVNWYGFTVTATGDGLSVSRTYTVMIGPANGVQIQLSQSAATIQPPGTATVTVVAEPIGGVTVPANAAGASAAILSTLPTGVTGSWSSPTVTTSGAVSWRLTLTADTTALSASDPICLSVQITDATRGLIYSTSQNFTLLISLLASVSVGSTPGLSIPPTFMGLSHEWDIRAKIGTAATGANAIYRQLLMNLMAYGSGPINIRIGGESTDYSGEPSSTSVEPFAEVAQAVGAQYELGVNLGSDNVGLATDQATAYTSQMPPGSLLALEVGNEPDLYYENGYRPSTYTVQDYFTDFSTWAGSIMPVIPSGTKLMGPSWASPGMLSELPMFLSQFSQDLAIVSQHSYGADYNSNPPVDVLLSPGAATTVPLEVAPAVIEAHAAGIPFRIGEINSVDDGGIEGISDAFSAALWAVDAMFNYASVGVDGINWHASDNNYYNPFNFTTSTANGTTTYALSYVRPLYYGLIMFQAATGNNAQLLPVNLSTPANLTAWATVDASSVPRLVVINKDENLSGTVQVNIPGYNQASVFQLQAPAYTSTSGVTFGGQTFDGSTDGTIQGTLTPETIQGSNGVFLIPVGVTSAALVVFSN